MESIQSRRRQSLLQIPKQIFNGALRLVKGSLWFVKSILNPIRKLLNMLFLQIRIEADPYADFENRMKNSIFLYHMLDTKNKENFRKNLYNSKQLYFMSRRSFDLDRARYIAISMTMNNINNYNQFHFNELPGKIKTLMLFPFKLMLVSFNLFSKFFTRLIGIDEKIAMIRYPRYINKNTSKIENYSESRALAYQNIIKNKKL